MAKGLEPSVMWQKLLAIETPFEIEIVLVESSQHVQTLTNYNGNNCLGTIDMRMITHPSDIHIMIARSMIIS